MSIKRDLVASTYVINEREVLLLFHQKLKKWLPAGGHVDPNETAQEAAIRETKEETGLDVELFSFQKNLDINEKNAISLPCPFLCLLEEIPAYKEVPYHQHFDFIFTAKVLGGVLKENPPESDGIKWFSLDNLTELEGNPSFFEETLQILNYLSENL